MRRFFFAFERILTAALIFTTVYLFVGFLNEVEGRRDQTCTIFERAQARDVRRLKDTYAYLVKLPQDERGDSINIAIRASLRNLEAEAKTDDAPKFCDEPGVGEKEPDPRIPRRPKSLK